MSNMPPQRQQIADDIQVLKGLEVVRRRPGMYMGLGPQSVYHMLYEVLDYAVNEAMAGYCDHITITINADRSITISDNGRGLPVAMHPYENLSMLEVELTVLLTGRRVDDYRYHVFGGLHGVGLKAVNALSEWLRVEVRREGY